MAKPSPRLAAIARQPDADAPRLAYADAIGGAEAELVRVQIARARLPAGDARDGALARREQAVWNPNARRWVQALQKLGLNAWTFDRGVITGATIMGSDFVRQKCRLLGALPTLRSLGFNVSSPKEARFIAAHEPLVDLDDVRLWSFQSTACWKVWLGSEVFARLRSLRVQCAPSAAEAPALARGALPALRDLCRLEWPAKVLAATLPAMAGLREITTDHTPMTRAQIAALVDSGAIARLDRLQLFEAGLTDAAVAPLWTAPPGLRELMLLSNRLTSRSVEALADSPLGATLESLDLGYCPVGPAVAALARLPALTTLKLRGVDIEGAALAKLLAAIGPRLRVLKLGGVPLGSSGVRALAGAALPVLEQLELGEMGLDAAAITAMVPALSAVRALDLAGNPLGDAGARALLGLGQVRSLGLESCGIATAALAGWPRKAGLSEVELNGNHIVDQAAQAALTSRFGPRWFGGPGLVLGYQQPAEGADAITSAADDASEDEPQQRRKPAAPPQRRDRARGLTELQARPHFATWDGYVDAKAVARCEHALHRAAAALLALGAQATAAQQKAVLKRCVLALNQIDATFHCLQTIEREDVDAEFALLVRYTPWAAWERTEGESLIDEWRDF